VRDYQHVRVVGVSTVELVHSFTYVAAGRQREIVPVSMNSVDATVTVTHTKNDWTLLLKFSLDSPASGTKAIAGTPAFLAASINSDLGLPEKELLL